DSRRSYARTTVWRATPSSAAAPRVGGRRAPGGRSPARIAPRRVSYSRRCRPRPPAPRATPVLLPPQPPPDWTTGPDRNWLLCHTIPGGRLIARGERAWRRQGLAGSRDGWRGGTARRQRTGRRARTGPRAPRERPRAPGWSRRAWPRC